MTKISPDLKQAYAFWAQGSSRSSSSWSARILAEGLRDVLAELLEAKFKANNHCITAERKGDGVTAYRTNFDDNDPRYSWQRADWQPLLWSH